MFTSFYRLLAQDLAFSVACAAVSVMLAVVGLWAVGVRLGEDPSLLLAWLPRAPDVAP